MLTVSCTNNYLAFKNSKIDKQYFSYNLIYEKLLLIITIGYRYIVIFVCVKSLKNKYFIL